MDIKTELKTPEVQQRRFPEIRQIKTLDNIPRIISPKPILTAEKIIKLPQKKSNFIRFVIMGLVFFGILGLELAIIYRYGKLNKRLYAISVSHKNRAATLQKKLLDTSKIRDKLIASRHALVRNYSNFVSQNKISQFKLDNYKNISKGKLSKINILKGDLRVYNARIEAAKAQNEILIDEVKKKDGYINELTLKLVNNIGGQELLVNENLYLKSEVEKLIYELSTQKVEGKTQTMEDKDANQ